MIFLPPHLRPIASSSRLVLSGGMLALLLGLPMSSAVAQTFTGRGHDIEDGDTIHVLRSGGQIVVVHLWGIDAPEIGQPYGAAARQVAWRAVLRQRIRVVERDDDRAGRPVAEVRIDGETLNERLVRKGLAWHCEAQAPGARRLKRLERRARVASRGLWSHPNPRPPWLWRENRQNGRGRPDQDC